MTTGRSRSGGQFDVEKEGTSLSRPIPAAKWRDSLVTYAMIVGATIVVVANPVTFTFLVAFEDWWALRQYQAFLVLIDAYIVTMLAAGALWMRKRQTLALTVVIALLILFPPFAAAADIAVSYYRFAEGRSEQAPGHDVGGQKVIVSEGELGWSLRPSASAEVGYRGGGATAQYVIDEKGRRGMSSQPDGVSRLLFFGDSFIFGIWMSEEDTALGILARKLRGRAAIANYGVPAYGLEQMYGRLLRYADDIRPGDNVVFAPYSLDLTRNLIWADVPCNLYFRNMSDDESATFPYFDGTRLNSRRLSETCDFVVDFLMHMSPLPVGVGFQSLRRWYQGDRIRHNADAIFTAARRASVARGANFSVLFIASGAECARGDHVFDIASLATTYASMIDHCPTDRDEIASLAHHDRFHWSKEGNRWAADALEKMLLRMGLVPPS